MTDDPATPADDEAHESDATNKGVSADQPAEGADDAPAGDADSPGG